MNSICHVLVIFRFLFSKNANSIIDLLIREEEAGFQQLLNLMINLFNAAPSGLPYLLFVLFLVAFCLFVFHFVCGFLLFSRQELIEPRLDWNFTVCVSQGIVSHNRLALIFYSYKTLYKSVSQSLLVFFVKGTMEIAQSNLSY